MTGRANNLTIKLFISLVLIVKQCQIIQLYMFAANPGAIAEKLCIGKCKILSYLHAVSEQFCPIYCC